MIYIVMGKSVGNKVAKLLFISKPGGNKKCNQPGRKAAKKWFQQTQKIEIEVVDLGNKA